MQGLRYAWKGRNLRIQFALGLAAIILGLIFQITRLEWLVVLVFTGLVPAFEVMNTAIEDTVNFISPEFHPLAGKIKDLAAGAVLILSVFAFIAGVVIFVPYLFTRFTL